MTIFNKKLILTRAVGTRSRLVLCNVSALAKKRTTTPPLSQS
jgi:hypothetical protein